MKNTELVKKIINNLADEISCQNKTTVTVRTIQDIIFVLIANSENERAGKLLIHEIAKINLQHNFRGQTYLTMSIKNHNSEMVDLLVSLGAKIDFAAEEYLLIMAVKNIDGKIVRMFLKNGANPDVISKNKNTPLLEAIRQRNKHLVKIILEYNVDINLLFPLHLAVREGELNIVKMLVERGADVNLRDEIRHVPPLYYALREKTEKLAQIANYLITNGAKIGTKCF